MLCFAVLDESVLLLRVCFDMRQTHPSGFYCITVHSVTFIGIFGIIAAPLAAAACGQLRGVFYGVMARNFSGI